MSFAKSYIYYLAAANMKLVYIYGPPAVGKLTVAKELAKLTDYVLFDNHSTLDYIKNLFGKKFFWGSKYYMDLALVLRLKVIETAAKFDFGIIHTQAMSKPKFAKKVMKRVKKHKGEVCFVRLITSLEEIQKRVTEDRPNKIHTVEELEKKLLTHNFFIEPSLKNTLEIDNTNKSPKQVAVQIKKHFNL